MTRLFTHSGSDGPSALYNTEGPFWASVTRDDRDRDVPAFHVSVKKLSEEVLAFTYEPELDPGPGPLSENIVTRIVREQIRTGGEPMRLKKQARGSWQLPSGDWIVRTEWDGPLGGRRYLWELVTDGDYGPEIRNDHGPWYTLREAREEMAEVLAA